MSQGGVEALGSMNSDVPVVEPRRRWARIRALGHLGRKNNKATQKRDELISAMEKAVRALFLDGDEARNVQWESWRYYLSYAVHRENSNRKAFYVIGIISLVSAITVPALVGLNLSGTGGVIVRWVTFAFSLVTALAAGMLTLYRIGDRWLMYRRLMESLMVAGRSLVDSADSRQLDAQVAWTNFVSATEKAISDYDKTYETAVILVARHTASGEH